MLAHRGPSSSSTRATVPLSRTRVTRTPTAFPWRSRTRPRRARSRACGTAATTGSGPAPSTSRATAFRSPMRRPRTRRARNCSAGSNRYRVLRCCCARRWAPSDAVDRVVLRSNYNSAPAPRTAERHIVAPKVSQRTAEMHSVFDTNGSPSVVDANAYALITAKESQQVSDLSSAQPDPAGTDVYYFDVDGVTVPYLPDPVATGARAARSRRGDQRCAGRLRRQLARPRRRTTGIARDRARATARSSTTPRTIASIVFLPKAERRLVRSSAVPDANAILAVRAVAVDPRRGVVRPSCKPTSSPGGTGCSRRSAR